MQGLGSCCLLQLAGRKHVADDGSEVNRPLKTDMVVSGFSHFDDVGGGNQEQIPPARRVGQTIKKHWFSGKLFYSILRKLNPEVLVQGMTTSWEPAMFCIIVAYIVKDPFAAFGIIHLVSDVMAHGA